VCLFVHMWYISMIMTSNVLQQSDEQSKAESAVRSGCLGLACHDSCPDSSECVCFVHM